MRNNLKRPKSSTQSFKAKAKTRAKVKSAKLDTSLKSPIKSKRKRRKSYNKGDMTNEEIKKKSILAAKSNFKAFAGIKQRDFS